jgi:hypothetical protein
MKLSKFFMEKTVGSSPLNLGYYASVSVETGFLWWKRTERRDIHRNYVGHWYFVDTGKFTPGFQAEELERAHKAYQGMK